jgi:signal peptidase
VSELRRLKAFDRLSKPLGWTATILLAVVLLLGVGILMAPSFDWHVEKILSGSMEPALQVGGAVVSRPVQPEDIEVGNIISYHPPTKPDALVCHRVVDIESADTLIFQTKGDANEEIDAYTVPADNIVGRVAFDIPLLGHVAEFAGTMIGLIVLLYVPALILITGEVRNIWVALEEREETKGGRPDRDDSIWALLSEKDDPDRAPHPKKSAKRSIWAAIRELDMPHEEEAMWW